MALTFAIPDIHGRFRLLQQALDAIDRIASRGTVVFLGDYVDRGPDTRQVIERLIAGPDPGWHWVCLEGNHEFLMVRSLRERRPVTWLKRTAAAPRY